MLITIINGPNLNLIGSRETSIYGTQTMDEMLFNIRRDFPQVEFDYFQSNQEGALIDKLQQIPQETDGIIINAGGLSHTSIALADAVAAVKITVIEVHISNIAAREAYRHHSYITAHCQGIIAGLGLAGYLLAVRYLVDQKNMQR